DASGATLAKRQQVVNHLLEHIYDHTHFTDLKNIAGTFSPEAATSIYTDDMEELRDGRLLEQHHWFSLFNTRQRMLFEVLIHCKSWECFLDNAAYFRERMNEGEFVYAIYVAVIHSGIGHGIVIPPIYEVTPHIFTNSEVINKAYSAKMTQTPGRFNMDFTGTKKNKEQRVAYFGEDIGMNIHHVTWHMDFPFWWKDSYGYHLDRKGELFFWVHHQLTARFDSERISNWIDVVDEIHWSCIEGFAPHTSYKYGGEFPARPDNVHFEDVDGVARVRDSRIRDALAHGYLLDNSGNKSSVYSPNVQYYGAIHNTAHIMIGRQGDHKFDMPPGVMEHFETATRDPSFFRLHKYMDNIFKEHKDSLPPYTKNDIAVPGVVIDSVAQLKTFFDTFEVNLGNAKVADVAISADVHRINHEEFSYNIDISNTDKIFICPVKDDNGIMDKFYKSIDPGTNHIVRKSVDSSVTVPDRQYALDLHMFERSCGIPNRDMIIIESRPDGMDFALFVTVDDPEEIGATHSQHGIKKYPDKKPMGYPVDRSIPDNRVFLESPNIKRTYVKVFHDEHGGEQH
uniref:Hemocyanin B chain n=1 Tax=Astacus leptodactylus TaxID=6717 RepID=HCYB_ASTLP|nr:RecName: Full=Hemocyanin B chain [Astacus leptodactylus]